MNRSLFYTLLLLAFTVMASAVDKQEKPIVFKGKVSCKGQGVAGVMVTDGVSVTQTDSNGEYLLTGNKNSEFVYLSSPAGYTVPVENSVPQFFRRINENRNGNTDFQVIPAGSDDTQHGFVVWADPQIKSVKEAQLAREVVGDLKELINRKGSYIFHGMGCGDIVGDNPILFDSTKTMLSELGIPFYQSIGNHDMQYSNRSNESAAEMFKNHFGPDYYSFSRGEIHYVVLNDVFYIGRDYFYIGYIPETQLAWLEKDLALVDTTKTIVVALHIPTALNQQDIDQFSYSNISKSVSNKKALYNLLAPYQAHIVSGHMHVSNNVVISPKLFEHNVSSVCGAWWQGPFAQDGTPKGYAVFEANGAELSWYFKSAGYNKDYQFRVYNVGENQEQKEYLTANVWNWDPEWKIFWYEDGKKMGEMEQYSGKDPGTVDAFSDKDKLDYKWIGAATTNHLFRAKPQNASAEITVKVIDRFGNSYSKKIEK